MTAITALAAAGPTTGECAACPQGVLLLLGARNAVPPAPAAELWSTEALRYVGVGARGRGPRPEAARGWKPGRRGEEDHHRPSAGGESKLRVFPYLRDVRANHHATRQDGPISSPV